MQKRFVILVLLLTGLCQLQAQTPYSWSFRAQKTADKTYEIHCTAEVNAPWHTYSQFTPDGGPLPTKFSFVKNPLCNLDGAVKENGKMVTKHETAFGVDVKYFEGTVDFVQCVKLKGNATTNFSGSVEFMVCNDEQCLPPTTQKFNLILTK
jgi:hypothetical protein